MKKTTQGLLVGAAIAGMLGVSGLSTQSFAAGDEGKVKCEGGNACKGHGGCKSAANECKGKNGCKGQSFTMAKNDKACAKAQAMNKPKDAAAPTAAAPEAPKAN